jgi:hypothetical protein
VLQQLMCWLLVAVAELDQAVAELVDFCPVH